ncbi:hypothetical protein VTK73DRAFT_8270 [Phialemonium thermophilum]|uniref:Uncharacterized protein n=1 Tax=Phialemonium thermophilum TaxID=223376 RepID=A0ABR3W9L7_9PEZI
MWWSLAGKKCVVTGANQGIGFAIAKRFLGEGAHVCLVGRSAARVDEAVATLKDVQAGWLATDGGGGSSAGRGADGGAAFPAQAHGHGQLEGHVCDVNAGQKGWADLFAQHPDVDVLVNCAGVARDRPLARLEDDDVAAVLDTNLRAAVWGCKHASRRMISSGKRGGCIINVSSLLAVKARTGASVYAASKAGLLGLTTSLSQELGRWGIRVNALVPGYIETRMIQDLPDYSKLKENIPLKRFGHVDEVADAAAFLAKNPYASNCILNLDGGLSAT